MGGGPGSALGAQRSVQETPLSGAGVFGSLAEGMESRTGDRLPAGRCGRLLGQVMCVYQALGNQENVEMGYQNSLSGLRMGVRRKGLIYR